MATAFPKNFPGSDLNAQKIKKKIEVASNGNFEIEHYGAGELVPAFEIFDAIRNGTIDCGVSAPITGFQNIKLFLFFVPYREE